MKDLYNFFRENFREGNRWELTMRLAGSCALAGVPLDTCISFYKKFSDLDDEDRVKLIKRTYDKVNNGERVITLLPYGFTKNDILSYFSIINNDFSLKENEIESLEKALYDFIPKRQKKLINLDEIGVEIDKRIHIKEYFYLLKRKITEYDIKAYSIRAGIGRFENRVIFPVFDKNRDCIYFVARSIRDDIKPKYLNSPLPKNNVIWNYYNCDFTNTVIVCEGIINAITAQKYTGYQSVATLGKYMTDEQCKMLSCFTHIVFCFDGDVPLKYLKELIGKVTSPIIEYIEMPVDKDVNDMKEKEFVERFESRKMLRNNFDIETIEF
jgi:hypothetical protein